MIKFIEATGKNEEAAIASALARLGLDRDDVSVEVLERAKSGFLGIGSSPAKVKVSYEAPGEEVPPVAAPAPVVAQGRAVESPAPAREVPARAPAAAESAADAVPVKTPPAAANKEEAGEEDLVARIDRFLVGLLSQMEVEATPRIEAKEEGGYQVFLEGEKLGALIGHRGETLDAIQQLTNYSVNRGRAKRVRIHIDVEHYRAKREESLKRLANKVAGKVIKYRRNITLEPMNAYERHVIHEALQDYPDVVTYSTGAEPNRRTVVAYSKGKHSY